VNPRSVLAVAKLKKGECYSTAAAREDTRSILKMGYFDNVEVHFDDISRNLTFAVVEKPYIERIVFNGNSEFSTRNLKRMSVLKEKKYYDFSKLEETKEKINALYKDKGYADCNIEVYPTIDVNTNKMTITFLIIENSRVAIEEVKVVGMIFFKEKKLLELMKTKPGGIFNEDIYQTDLKSIETFYKNNGFIDYKFVSSSVVRNDARTKMSLTLNISEGSRYKIGSITYDGNFTIYNKEIEKIIKLKKDQIFSNDKIVETANDICEFYYNRGYLDAKVVPCFNKDADVGIIGINLSIKEGLVLYVGNIYINGLISTRDKVIRRELLVNPGEVLTKGKLSRSIEKIYNLGFVNNIEYQVLATDKPDVVNLMISVTERDDFGTLTGGVGYSTDNKFIATAQIQRMNVFGLGKKLSLNLFRELRFKKSLNYEVGWEEPWIFDKSINLNLSAYNLKKNKDYNNFRKGEENRIGFIAKIGHGISDYASLLFGYAYEYVKPLPVEARIKKTSKIDKIKNLKDVDLQKSIKISSVFTQFACDLRNHAFNPSRGSTHVADLTLASSFLGGDVNFFKGTVKSTWFFPTFWKFILSVDLHNGVIISYGQSRTFMNRFYLGGLGSIRGYAFRTEIGPANGGSVMGFMNIEHKFPIAFDGGKEFIQGVMFCDIGGNWENYRAINLVLGNESGNIRSGIGLGVKIMIPVFPLKIEWGYGLNHKVMESRSHFYFSFGNN
jgi:outer membrane protein insertion porin family